MGGMDAMGWAARDAHPMRLTDDFSVSAYAQEMMRTTHQEEDQIERDHGYLCFHWPSDSETPGPNSRLSEHAVQLKPPRPQWRARKKTVPAYSPVLIKI